MAADDGNAPAVFRGTEYSPLRTTVALVFWLGTIHLVVALTLAALFLFPSPLSFAIFALLLFFMAIPLNDKDKFGQDLARFICKYACGYFPVTLHVEDYSAFDPSQAYGVCPFLVLVGCGSHHPSTCRMSCENNSWVWNPVLRTSHSFGGLNEAC
ncbi:hypothetical protein ACLOJK_036231 [Asimina triloba]